MIKALIVEDEPNNSERLKFLLDTNCNDIKVIAISESVEEAKEAVKKDMPDLVFLDIELPDGTGFDFLKLYPETPFQIIFTTSFDKYALKAIKFSAADYLLKPIEKDELIQSVEKIKRLIKQNIKNPHLEIAHQKNPAENFTKIALPSLAGFDMVEINNIIRCEAEGSYTRFYIKNKNSCLVSRNLKEYEDLLAEYNFVRIHHAHLININHVINYHKGEGGYVIMSDHSQVEVSKRKKTDFLDKFPGL